MDNAVTTCSDLGPGIHGKPFVEWNGGGGRRGNEWLGYCPHGVRKMLPFASWRSLFNRKTYFFHGIGPTLLSSSKPWSTTRGGLPMNIRSSFEPPTRRPRSSFARRTGTGRMTAMFLPSRPPRGSESTCRMETACALKRLTTRCTRSAFRAPQSTASSAHSTPSLGIGWFGARTLVAIPPMQTPTWVTGPISNGHTTLSLTRTHLPSSLPLARAASVSSRFIMVFTGMLGAEASS
jgi:hypothetical protein